MKYLIAGNWKMHKTVSEAMTLARQIHQKSLAMEHLDFLICPPFTALAGVQETLKESNVAVGAQNMHYGQQGAFTGEISASMLTGLGLQWVLLGHSERRHVFGENDDLIHKKLDQAFNTGMNPVLCVGETLPEREAGQVSDVLKRQISSALKGFPVEVTRRLTVAYEPVWAIGTGVVATPEQAQEAHQIVRNLLAELFSDSASSEIRLLYGGSVKPDNAGTLMSQPDINGVLVGGASLEADSFMGIAAAV